MTEETMGWNAQCRFWERPDEILRPCGNVVIHPSSPGCWVPLSWPSASLLWAPSAQGSSQLPHHVFTIEVLIPSL